MAALLPDMSIKYLQSFMKDVYYLPNIRHFEACEMLDQIQRFAMRGLKGIRKGDIIKSDKNLVISLSFFVSLLNRLEIDLEQAIWERFPYKCSYCGNCPCSCKLEKKLTRQKIFGDLSKRPKTLFEFQKMFEIIYPSSTRSLEHAGVHFAEELGEFSEALWAYRASKSDEDFKHVEYEAADFFSCILAIFNSLNLNLAEELSKMYPNNCHACGNSPCSCNYAMIKNYNAF